MLVIAAALIPLFLLMPMIAKYQDIAHSTQAASRYVAFEAMVRNGAVTSGWKPEAQLADEVRSRFFESANAPIVTQQAPDRSAAFRQVFWTDPKGSALIASLGQDVSLSFGTGNAAMHDGGFQGAHDGRPFPLSGKMSLAARGLYSGNVSVKLANLPAGLEAYVPFDKIDLTIRRSTSVAIDTWTGRGPGDVQGRLDNAVLSPVAKLQAVGRLVSPIVSGLEAPLMTMEGPKLGELDFWQDVVPPDRLRSKAP